MPDIIAQNELTADPGERSVWLAEGDDPFFLIRFPFFRKRYFAIRLTASDGEIDPKLYINTGHGFREEDSRDVGRGKDFLIVADVGAFGTIRALRVDPTNEPCRFVMTVEEFDTTAAVEAHILDQRRQSPALKDVRFWKLPRFWKTLPALPFRRKSSSLQAYVTRAAELAGEMSLAAPRSADRPWLSIVVPVYNAPAQYLDDLLSSFLKQDIPGTELILSDDGSTSAETLDWFASRKPDPRINCLLNGVNRGIASTTNAGLDVAKGDWITLLDHDDMIAPHGLKVIRKAVEASPGACFLYTDELIVDEALKPVGLLLKPAYDPVLLSGVNYINHFSIYRRERLKEIGLLRTTFEGSQDYDLLLRYLEGVNDSEVLHVPYPAYWWRRNGKSYSHKFLYRATDSARRALHEHFERNHKPNTVLPALTETLHRVNFGNEPAVGRPKISIIIPNRDSFDLISTVLKGIYEGTDYPNYEVIIVDNGTTESATIALYEDYARRHPSFQFHVKARPFNFSRAINEGMAHASGDHFLLLNNDIEITSRDWLDEMVQCLSYDRVGIVGAKLLYPNRKLQHAGVIVGFGGLAGHWYLNKPERFGGPMNRLHLRNSLTCVTGAAMLITGECAREIGLWDEENFSIAYNDVDYCLRAYKAGYRIVWTPFACLVHHESVSRGSDISGERRARFEKEKANLRRLHETQGFFDPACHPGYSRSHSDPRLLPLPYMHKARSWFIA
ncbi:glycosyltransferase family 2 protein [Rhizobiaceae bacterium BDR2-2]|uniref:Glycosyltransferase family 2 protein n=1 Tax=Ectorhizobium quercum TaxID=2965071 RepID=A0AAE3N3S4_9HYPH|nr:glycosyltransferase family 2 protein [Ectorhizobium quercum]MCX8996201.1 glycosyltransferase family 2 protein [Ectorhizobium quercum]MCX8998760.1 glycosyltransferase family 2 protein [Ectorhizobium quercum]